MRTTVYPGRCAWPDLISSARSWPPVTMNFGALVRRACEEYLAAFRGSGAEPR
ncbi:MAG: hypothetical protein HYV62_15875 [Candidatus Rokubacteria bacterium]|nr:hypothetical protein [Candidatus Rokubacteria bacterium]